MNTKHIIGWLAGILLCGSLMAQPTSSVQSKISESYTPIKGWPKATQKFYLDLRGGYGFKMGGGYNGFVSYTESAQLGILFDARGSEKRRQMRYSVGKGWQMGVNFGYRFNRYMALDAGLSYWHGDPCSALQFNIPCDKTGHVYRDEKTGRPLEYDQSWTFSDNPSVDVTNLGWVYIKDIFSGRTANLHASLRVSPGFKQWDPYLKFGINVLSGIVQYTREYGTNGLDNLKGRYENKDAYIHLYGYGFFDDYVYAVHRNCIVMSVGLTAAAGVTYNITSNVSVFAEWQMTLMTSSAYRDYRDSRAWILDDRVEERGNLNNRRIIENAFGDPEWVRRDFVLPFNNTGLNLGVKFSF